MDKLTIFIHPLRDPKDDPRGTSTSAVMYLPFASAVFNDKGQIMPHQNVVIGGFQRFAQRKLKHAEVEQN